MRAAPGFLRTIAGSALRPPFLAVLVLHGIVGASTSADHSRSADGQSSVVCASSAVDLKDVAGEAPSSGARRANAVCKDRRGSLLQVSSERHPQPSAAAPPPSEHGADGGSPEHERTSVALLSSAESLSSTEVFRREALRPSSLLLVVLILIAIACILLVVVRNVSDSFDADKNWKERPGEGIPLQSGGGGPAPEAAVRASPGPTTAQSLVAASPAPSMRQIPTGVPSPRPPFRAEDSLGSAMVDKHLCPGLVVPHGNECILAVPVLPVHSAVPRETACLNVQDLDGKSVIQAEVALPPSARGGYPGKARPLVSLRAGPVPSGAPQQAQPTLAYCKAAPDQGDRKRVYIYDNRDELFAQITKDSAMNCYVLSSGRTGLAISFEGEPLKRCLNVTNDQRQLLAETSTQVSAVFTAGTHYKLRVVSNVDVGLMICALFSIDCMELS